MAAEQGLLPLVHRALGLGQDHDHHPSWSRSCAGAARSSRCSTATSSARTSPRASASRRRTATPTSAGSRSSRPALAQRACRDHRRDLALPRDPRRGARDDGRPLRRGLRARPRSRSARSATSRASTPRPAPARSRSSPGVSDPYEPPENPELVIETEQAVARGVGAADPRLPRGPRPDPVGRAGSDQLAHTANRACDTSPGRGSCRLGPRGHLRLAQPVRVVGAEARERLVRRAVEVRRAGRGEVELLAELQAVLRSAPSCAADRRSRCPRGRRRARGSRPGRGPARARNVPVRVRDDGHAARVVDQVDGLLGARPAPRRRTPWRPGPGTPRRRGRGRGPRPRRGRCGAGRSSPRRRPRRPHPRRSPRPRERSGAR